MKFTKTDLEVFQMAMQPPVFNPDPKYKKNGGVENPNVGLGAITRWFLGGADHGKGMTPLLAQWLFFHAAQRNTTFVAGIGAAKTSGVAMAAIAYCLLIPYFRFTNTAPVAAQAILTFDWIFERINANPTLARHVTDIKKKPHPVIEWVNGAKIECRTTGIGGVNLRGIEMDMINEDEAGFDQQLQDTRTVLSGRMRGRRPDNRPRLNRLTLTTSPSDLPYLRELWDRGADPMHPEFNPQRYFSLRSTIYDNYYLSKEDIAEIEADISPEQKAVELLGEFPEGFSDLFPRDQVDDIFDIGLNNFASGVIEVETELGQEDLWLPTPPIGYRYNFHPSYGLIHYEKPYEEGGLYVLGGDPGTGAPPRRNAGVVMVWRVDKVPHEVVYFEWVDGKGKYEPFLASYHYAMSAYFPVYQGVDSTGPQSAIHELAFEQWGYDVDAIKFNRDKNAMLTSLRVIIQQRQLTSPLIKGFRTQLMRYVLPDRDITQDIVCAAMMCAYLARFAEDGVDDYEEPQVPRDSRGRLVGGWRRRR